MNKRNCKRKIRRLNIFFSDGNSEHSGISSDFSCNGLFIRTRKGFSEGTTLQMKLEFENGKILQLTGIVKRAIRTMATSLKNGMGIELISIPSEYDKFIDDLYSTQ
ncbi:MAG: hypothetical protein A2X59_12020 [Nitrospirae bacterium GWC2_42_7]|nr:MAG: hypothetical protein A2X59_12020 [Nitrospirae bacterium GWC2_42_7]